MLITNRRRIKGYSAPVYVGGQYPTPAYSLPLGVESVGFTGKFQGTIFKYGPIAALAALNHYYIDDAWFTGPTYNVNSQADWNNLNKTGVAEWSTIVVQSGLTLTPISLPRRTGWDPTTGGGLVRIIPSAKANLPPQSNGTPGAARRVNSSHVPYMFNIVATSPGYPGSLAVSTSGNGGGWVIQGANIFSSYGTSTTSNTTPLIAIDNSAYNTDATQTNQYIIFSQCYIHNDETGPGDVIRGVQYTCGKYCAFIDSDISGFIYDGGDSQAIWISSKAPGWLGIFNCRLRALSQGFIIGGDDPPALYVNNRPKHIDSRYNVFDPDSSGKWVLAQYIGESKGVFELKTGENVLSAFCRATVRMYSGSYEASILAKAGDQGGGANGAYAARVENLIVWCNVVDDTNAGGIGIADIYPASPLSEGVHRADFTGNLFKPGTLQGQPGAPSKDGYRYLVGYAYSDGRGGQHIRIAHNTADARNRMFEFVGPPEPANKTLADFYLGENVNMYNALSYGPVVVGGNSGTFTNATYAQALAWCNQQLNMQYNVNCTTTRQFPADYAAKNNITVARDTLIENYIGGNYRIKAAYQNHSSDGLPPGAFVDLIEAETGNLI